uniref:Major capsid protein n=1 Tax=Corticoviridae sp. TaxID=2832474 RepID=A0A8D9PDX5_9VIRU|nr:MAG TPA: major capsid protein [Corticoviridae sp.]
MSAFLDQQIDLQNVRPGATAILKLSYDATYDKIHLNLGGGLLKTHIKRIEGKANGTTFFVDEGSRIGMRDAYQRSFVDAGIITLDFTEPNSRGGAPAQYLASIPRNMLQSLTFEVTIDATAPVALTLTADAEYRDPTPNTFILRRKDFNVALPLIGENDLVLPSDVQAGGLIKRIWLHHTGNVTKAELRTNGAPRIRALTSTIGYTQKRNNLVPQANVLVLDFLSDGNLMNMLNTQGVKEAFLRLTVSAADSVTAYIDYIDDIRKLK